MRARVQQMKMGSSHSLHRFTYTFWPSANEKIEAVWLRNIRRVDCAVADPFKGGI